MAEDDAFQGKGLYMTDAGGEVRPRQAGLGQDVTTTPGTTGLRATRLDARLRLYEDREGLVETGPRSRAVNKDRGREREPRKPNFTPSLVSPCALNRDTSWNQAEVRREARRGGGAGGDMRAAR